MKEMKEVEARFIGIKRINANNARHLTHRDSIVSGNMHNIENIASVVCEMRPSCINCSHKLGWVEYQIDHGNLLLLYNNMTWSFVLRISVT